MRIKLLMLLVFCVLASCDKNTVYKDFDRGFEDNRWLKADIKTYDFTITDASQSYDLILDFSHIAGYQFATIPVKLNIVNPDKSVTTENVDVVISDGPGNELGDCSGDICDLQQTIFENKKLEVGNYRIVLSNEFNTYLPNILGIGIRVKFSGE